MSDSVLYKGYTISVPDKVQGQQLDRIEIINYDYKNLDRIYEIAVARDTLGDIQKDPNKLTIPGSAASLIGLIRDVIEDIPESSIDKIRNSLIPQTGLEIEKIDLSPESKTHAGRG